MNLGDVNFQKNPWIDEKGRAVKVGQCKLLRSMLSFRKYMAIRYFPLLKVLLLLLLQFFFFLVKHTGNLKCLAKISFES